MNDRKKLIFWAGASLIALGFIFQIGETWHFGWNLRAESMEEALCDLAALAMRYAGLIAIVYAWAIMPQALTVTHIVKADETSKVLVYGPVEEVTK